MVEAEMTAKAKDRDEAVAFHEACRGSHEEREKALEIWEGFSLEEVRAAKTPGQIIRALKRCPPEHHPAHATTSAARSLALAKLVPFEDELLRKFEKGKDINGARELYYALPHSVYRLRSRLEALCYEFATMAVGTIKDLDSAVDVLGRYASFNKKVYKLAKKLWDDYAMVEAKKAKTIEDARRVYLRARASRSCPARKFLEEKFFTPPTPE